jgi:hypothetical protein
MVEELHHQLEEQQILEVEVEALEMLVLLQVVTMEHLAVKVS